MQQQPQSRRREFAYYGHSHFLHSREGFYICGRPNFFRKYVRFFKNSGVTARTRGWAGNGSILIGRLLWIASKTIINVT